MKYQEVTTEGINKLMDVFYTKIRNDKNGLGDLFNQTIGTSDEEWKHHKAKIASFWEGMILGSGDYSGHPLKAHIELPPFPQEFFALWLALFEESLNLVFESNLVQVFLQRAQMIAQRFQSVLYR
ncbi:group III truncated hemoglobin [Helicobacter kayseriensis]|uniref:group III truncated hemoglobin n=1 Tax=Helicobacter kayseriensis TaxID=2905877 RepID=UPI001E522009|nr:group III truncated hemoglobin [Helicobacter kayseriensis]MCE3046975.1 group III truncated hemoglobin [Helicobacter kayseriensis]MCE3048365.1 group III truncated hemoglobin [Helicobacter kayseriensis]